MKRLPTLLVLLAALLALPAAAAAQGPLLPVEPDPGTTPPPVQPKPAKAGIKLKNGIRTKRARFFMRGQTVKVVSRVRPFVRGQVAVLEGLRNGRVLFRRRAAIRRSKGRGRAVFRFDIGRSGGMRLRVRHRATAQQKAFVTRTVLIKAGRFRAGEGSRGVKVTLLQRGLKRLGFAVGITGVYDGGTARAVNAFRKTNNMSRNGYASPRVYSKVFRRKGAFKPRIRRRGRYVEFDWSRQVLALIANGRAHHVYHASSGTAATPTVFGTFTFYRKQPGTNSLGMVHSNYFIRGYAIHGYKSVPNYPASHGCIRVPIPNALQIDRQINLGERIYVYR